MWARCLLVEPVAKFGGIFLRKGRVQLWFTEYESNQIGRITPDGQISEFPTPSSTSRPTGITAGPDGNLWFTEYNSGRIGRITPTGSITEFPLPSSSCQPSRIVAGPDGNLWFVERNSDKVGRITTSGAITRGLDELMSRVAEDPEVYTIKPVLPKGFRPIK